MNIYLQIAKLLLTAACLFFFGCDQPENEPVQYKTAPAPQQQFQGLIIAVGDSLTAGLGVAENDAWPFLLQNKLQQQGYNWQVLNAGVSGETSSGTLSRIKWILAQKPDIVILETGANDGLRGIPVDVIKQNLTEAVRMLQEQGTIVILAGMQIVQNLGPEYTRDFAKVYPAVAEKTGSILIPFFLKDVAGELGLNQEDTIHPNEQGHKVIVNTIYPFIERGINERL